jgi:hypothetical protein
MKVEKITCIYSSLSFRLYDLYCPGLDTEWLLSTLFDASLLSTSKAAGNGGSFFAPVATATMSRKHTVGPGVANSAHPAETIISLAAGLSSVVAQ